MHVLCLEFFFVKDCFQWLLIVLVVDHLFVWLIKSSFITHWMRSVVNEVDVANDLPDSLIPMYLFFGPKLIMLGADQQFTVLSLWRAAKTFRSVVPMLSETFACDLVQTSFHDCGDEILVRMERLCPHSFVIVSVWHTFSIIPKCSKKKKNEKGGCRCWVKLVKHVHA